MHLAQLAIIFIMSLNQVQARRQNFNVNNAGFIRFFFNEFMEDYGMYQHSFFIHHSQAASF
jgi:hypothetical protein